jgi:hypothetical protein
MPSGEEWIAGRVSRPLFRLYFIAFLMVSSISCYQIPVGNFIPRALFCDDLDQDGHIDLIIMALNGDVHLLFNNGDGTFQVRDSLPIHKRRSWTNTLFGFNNDGWNDLDGFYRTTDEDGNQLISLRIYISDAGFFDIDNYIDFPAMPELECLQLLVFLRSSTRSAISGFKLPFCQASSSSTDRPDNFTARRAYSAAAIE